MQEFFRQNDRNNDGRLTRDEFPEAARRMFDRIDANGDDVVTKEEHTEFRRRRGAR
jgi:hypothetical protein